MPNENTKLPYDVFLKNNEQSSFIFRNYFEKIHSVFSIIKVEEGSKETKPIENYNSHFKLDEVRLVRYNFSVCPHEA